MHTVISQLLIPLLMGLLTMCLYDFLCKLFK